MRDDRLSGLSSFIHVVRAGGFRKAANELGMTAGAVSEAVKRLEDRVGVRLLERSTRNVSLTDAGRDFYERCGIAFDSIIDAMQDVLEDRNDVTGTLRLTAPWSAGPIFLNKLVAKFLQAYPNASVDLIYDDRKLDLISSRIDAAIRSNNLLEKDTQSFPIGPKLQMCVVASPDYLERIGFPKSPKDLIVHDGIFFRITSNNKLAPWVFVEKNERYSSEPHQRFIVNDVDTALKMSELGLGLMYVYHSIASEKIKQGKLIALFLKEADIRPNFNINFISKQHMPSKLRAFIKLSQEIAV